MLSRGELSHGELDMMNWPQQLGHGELSSSSLLRHCMYVCSVSMTLTLIKTFAYFFYHIFIQCY